MNLEQTLEALDRAIEYPWTWNGGRQSDFDAKVLRALRDALPALIPATKRVDVERVRAVIAEMQEHLADGFVPYLYDVGNWADELTAAIGDKT